MEDREIKLKQPLNQSASQQVSSQQKSAVIYQNKITKW